MAVSFAPATAWSAKDDPQKAEARTHFERGVALSESMAWDGALAEFSRANDLYPTRGATKNAAVCLRKLRRMDEALDLLQAMIVRYPEMPVEDRWVIDRELKELEAFLGFIDVQSPELGAQVLVDGRAFGTSPVALIRVTGGSHMVRVYKEGYLPFEVRIEVASGQRKVVKAALPPLTESGELSVLEASGKEAAVVVDGTLLGKTPWTGRLAPGDHTVSLRGTGSLGTQPATAPVRRAQTSTLRLALEPLDAELRVDPNPRDASVALDGVVLGRGLWEGRVRTGPHKLDAAKSGFLPVTRALNSSKGSRTVQALSLERDPNSSLWGDLRRPRFVLEARVGVLLTSTFGGTVESGCEGACERSLPFGQRVALRAGYELPRGLGFSLDVGYLRIRQALTGRPVTLQEWPNGVRQSLGTADDELELRAAMLGASAGFRFGTGWVWGGRLGVGALVGSMSDVRKADIPANGATAGYAVGNIEEAPGIVNAYVSPELFVARELSRTFELRFGVELLACIATHTPSWKDKSDVVTPAIGFARFGEQTLLGGATFLISPMLSLGASL